MEFFDTHCHIQSAGLDQGERGTRELWSKAPELTSETIVANAKKVGVNRLLCVGCDLADSQLAVNFVQQRKNCWASVGIHPHEAKLYAGKTAQLEEFAELATQPKVVAVGECGLDYFYEHSPRRAQQDLLRFQIELAIKHSLPLVFHVREAFDDFWPIFDNYQGLRGVLHSYTDSSDNLTKSLERGLNIGVNGIATFAKTPDLDKVYRQIPDDRLLLETDAPFLAPKPYRGQINQPAHAATVAEYLADLRGQTLDQLAEQTTRNARQLFDV